MADDNHRAPQLNSLYFGDCLEVMREWARGILDLCYLDTPSTQRRITTFSSVPRMPIVRARIMAFEDIWYWG